MITQMTATDASLEQAVKLGVRVLEAIPKLHLTSDEAQAHIQSGVLTEVVEGVLGAHPDALDLVQLRKMLEAYQPFESEDNREPRFGYPKKFPYLTWRDRLEILQSILGGLSENGLSSAIDKLKLNVDDWVDDPEDPFLVPDWRILGETYAEATAIAWSLVEKQPWCEGKTHNYRSEQLTDDSLRLLDDKDFLYLARLWRCRLKGIPTTIAHNILGQQLAVTDRNVWPVFAQTGIRHQGKSARRVHVTMGAREWALGPYEVACILLTDGEQRLPLGEAVQNLGMHAIGAFYSFVPEEPHDGVLGFSVEELEKLVVTGCGWGNADDEFGAVTGSLRTR